jgi:ElaB/YqjD/DUF883 family membrane-anchored ribosome-binding protein
MYESQDRQRSNEPDAGDGVKAAGAEVMDRARDQLSVVREQAGERMEEGIDRVAEGAQQAADRVREEAENRGGVQGKVGIKAADTMEQAATYLRDHRSDEIWSDVERYAREHPMQAVGGAVFAGFLLGRILR